MGVSLGWLVKGLSAVAPLLVPKIVDRYPALERLYNKVKSMEGRDDLKGFPKKLAAENFILGYLPELSDLTNQECNLIIEMMLSRIRGEGSDDNSLDDVVDYDGPTVIQLLTDIRDLVGVIGEQAVGIKPPSYNDQNFVGAPPRDPEEVKTQKSEGSPYRDFNVLSYRPPEIIRNVAECKLCGDVIESVHRHDFQTCQCGEIHVDGGLDYLKRGAKDLSNIIERSEYAEDE